MPGFARRGSSSSALERELLVHNPCRVRGLRSAEGDRTPQFLTAAEARRFLEHADPEWRDFFAAAIYTGLRFGELVALRWSDVDLEHGVHYVRRSRGHDAPKSGHHRVVPMADELRAHWPSPRPGSHLVFPRRGVRGCAVDPTRDRIVAPRRALQRALDGARIDKPIRFHDLRHTFGTLLTRSGVNLRTVQAVMGHSTMRMTQRYAHLADDPALSARGFSLQGDKT
jgi:integrase